MNFTILFPLRSPFSRIDLDTVGEHTNISLDILGEHAGVLRVENDNLPHVILQAFANNAREIGYLDEGKVHWIINPNLFNIEQVIDAFGVVHEVQNLQEAT